MDLNKLDNYFDCSKASEFGDDLSINFGGGGQVTNVFAGRYSSGDENEIEPEIDLKHVMDEPHIDTYNHRSVSQASFRGVEIEVPIVCDEPPETVLPLPEPMPEPIICPSPEPVSPVPSPVPHIVTVTEEDYVHDLTTLQSEISFTAQFLMEAKHQTKRSKLTTRNDIKDRFDSK